MRKFVLFIATVALFSLVLAVPALARNVEVTAGPIWNDDDAQEKCEMVRKEVAAENPNKAVSWTGNWKTIKDGEQSVCLISIE
jgi:hypothetical protein